MVSMLIQGCCLAGSGTSACLVNMLLCVQMAGFLNHLNVVLPLNAAQLLNSFRWASLDIQ